MQSSPLADKIQKQYMVECNTIHNGKIMMPKEKLKFRPSVYGLIINDGKILVVNTRASGKYFFPGGGVEPGESLEECLRREVREEAGIEIIIGELFHFEENYFYYEPLDEAYHCFLLFYFCKPKSLELTDKGNEKGDEAEKPQWITLSESRIDDFQVVAKEVFMLLIQKFKHA